MEAPARQERGACSREWRRLLATVVVATFDQTRNTMQVANIIHLSIASLFTLAALGHNYMGTLGMAGAYHAMSKGYVDETWAKEHHLYWYNDIKAGKISTVPDDVRAPAAPRPATTR